MADHPYLCDYRRGWCWNGVESSPDGVGGEGRVVGGLDNGPFTLSHCWREHPR